MKRLPTGPAAREERPASQLIHDEPNVRVAAFHLLPGQVVPPHNSTSTVVVQVVEGEGTFVGEGSRELLRVGETAAYVPGEMHSIEAGSVPLRFLAFITPRPS